MTGFNHPQQSSRPAGWLLSVIGALVVTATTGGVVLYAEVVAIGPRIDALQVTLTQKIDGVEERLSQSDVQISIEVERLRTQQSSLEERLRLVEILLAEGGRK